ncbi:Ubiquinol-cytochrome C reductase iron-sulfur subunit [Caenispirillum salinarum AK4]|uniref:Ubiquinol-cytochrome c reductase iron-sulfur subunit n=1 Tax=Caenispirillum salinarum AK4 TaxID=1238182 RepID=K9HED3_9PROT|nr:ubiquinol-cytochrome c reductase iron-sulfur subunit [Caenispirillum salinarum]EKV28858.1 Ubiquinol-cytochrome C reductase iron-sulfur subunit [Caenispirillum salinarum AK4]
MATTETRRADVTDDPGRRDFLLYGTGAVAVVGTGLALWPFIDSINPTADVLALSSTELDLTPVAVGQRVTVTWRGKPVFVSHRTEEEIQLAVAADDDPKLINPATDASRVQNADWLVVVGICKHLGCVPLGQKSSDSRGRYGGWFCPCHGSQYDTSGRVRHGPAPLNLALPPYTLKADETVVIG